MQSDRKDEIVERIKKIEVCLLLIVNSLRNNGVPERTLDMIEKIISSDSKNK